MDEELKSFYLNNMFVEEVAEGMGDEKSLKSHINYVKYGIFEMDYHSISFSEEDYGNISIEKLLDCLYNLGLDKSAVSAVPKDHPWNKGSLYKLEYKIQFPHYDYYIGRTRCPSELECAIFNNELPMCFTSTEALAEYLFKMDDKLKDFEDNYLPELKMRAAKVYKIQEIAFATVSCILKTEMEALNLEYTVKKEGARHIHMDIHVDAEHVYRCTIGCGKVDEAMAEIISNVKNYLDGKGID